jgi:N-acetylglucosamine-6-phosphate deacetylase
MFSIFLDHVVGLYMTTYSFAITNMKGCDSVDNHRNGQLLFINACMYTPNLTIMRGYLRVSQGVIKEVGAEEKLELVIKECKDTGVTIIDLDGKRLIPGFIDIHVHGGGGFDVMSGDPADIHGLSLYHASRGTTTLLATTLTAPYEVTKKALMSIKKAMEEGSAGATVAGIHLEGPFLNPARCGAQNPAHIRTPSIEEMRVYQQCADGKIVLITVAPEMPEAMELIRFAVEQRMVVSIGHSAASFECIQEAVNNGASQITHLFNGMNEFHHRELGVPGAALVLDELAVELICDNIHIHPDLIKLVYRAKPAEKLLFITDCMSAAGLADGNYLLGNLPVMMEGGQVRLVNRDGSTGSLAGSCLTMDLALLNAMKATSLSLEDILPALTINPARQVGLHTRKGSIEVGKDADLVVLGEQLQVIATYVRGQQVYSL